MFVDQFYQDLVIIFNSFCSQDFLDSFEELGGKLGFAFGIGGKVNTGASGVERFDNFVFEIAGKDESAVARKLLSKRPK